MPGDLPPLGRAADADGPTARLGTHRAPDGSDGAPLRVDVARPHAALVVGKRGYGKSYTLGVLAEELARTDGVAPVVADTMAVFDGLTRPADGSAVPADTVRPRVAAADLTPRAWCDVLDLDPASAVGGLVWRVARQTDTLAGMRAAVADADADRPTRRAADNHLALAADWDVFDPGATLDLDGTAATVLSLADRDRAAANVVVRAVADRLYDRRLRGTGSLPWLLVDEAHVFFDGVAEGGLRTLLTRGRSPGVSLVLATQRPSAVPDVVPSQSDLLVVHRLTSRPDQAAVERARPTYAADPVADRTPATPGEATLVDDATETVHAVSVRERDTPHDGDSPRAGDR